MKHTVANHTHPSLHSPRSHVASRLLTRLSDRPPARRAPPHTTPNDPRPSLDTDVTRASAQHPSSVLASTKSPTEGSAESSIVETNLLAVETCSSSDGGGRRGREGWVWLRQVQPRWAGDGGAACAPLMYTYAPTKAARSAAPLAAVPVPVSKEGPCVDTVAATLGAAAATATAAAAATLGAAVPFGLQ